MKLIALSIFAVAFAHSVAGKISFGTCSQDIETLKFDDYLPSNPYTHNIMALDRDFISLIEAAEAFGFTMPFDFRCDELGAITPFKEISERLIDEAVAADEDQDLVDEFEFAFTDEDEFNSVFPDRPDAILKFMKYHEFAPFDAFDQYYICVDPFAVEALLVQLEMFGLEPNYSSANFLIAFNSLFSIFKKLNFTLKFHGAILTGGRKTTPGSWWNSSFLNGIEAYIPGYDASDNMVVLSLGEDFCENFAEDTNDIIDV